MNKLRRHELLEKVQSEVCKLKDVDFLLNAKSVDILFNGPSGFLRDFVDATVQAHWDRYRGSSVESYIRKTYDGVLILPIRRNEPVIVFKKLGYGLDQFKVRINVPCFSQSMSIIPIPYIICWKGKLLKMWPSVVRKQYSESFITNLMYSGSVGRGGGIEVPLEMVLGDNCNDILGGKVISAVKKSFREFQVLREKRGTIKLKNSYVEERDEFLIKQYQALGSPKRFPMQDLMAALLKRADQFEDEKQIKVYYCAENTIRRVLNKYKRDLENATYVEFWRQFALDCKAIDREYDGEIKVSSNEGDWKT